jgi:hypothetical protein
MRTEIALKYRFCKTHRITGKYDFDDIAFGIDVFLKLPPALKGADNIVAELMDLDEAETDAIVVIVQDGLDQVLDKPQALQFARHAIYAGWQIAECVKIAELFGKPVEGHLKISKYFQREVASG